MTDHAVKLVIVLSVLLGMLILMVSRVDAADPVITVVAPGATWTADTTVVFDVNVACATSDYAFINWDSSLVGWWRGEDSLDDSSGNGHTGIITGGVTYGTGAFGNAFQFGASADEVMLGDDSVFSFNHGEPFTYSVWVYPASMTATCDIVCKNINYRIYYDYENGRWAGVLGTGASRKTVYHVDADPAEKWTHLVMVYDPENSQLRMYGNGSLSYTDSAFEEGEFGTTDRLILGGSIYPAFLGLIDEFMIFNRVLSASEIQALYDANIDNISASFSGLSEMIPYDYTVWGVNSNGEDANTVATVTVDVASSAPTGTITSPQSPQRDSESSQTFSGTASDTNSDTTLALAILYWDFGQEFGASAYTEVLSGNSDTFAIAVTGLTNGTITWNIHIDDSAGNHGFIAENQTLIIGQDDYYVAPGGSDAAAGTIGAPFATIQHFADNCYAGDTCYIRAGTYRETITPVRSGTADAPIVFTAYPAETVTVSGANTVSTGWEVHSGNIYKTTAMDWTMGIGLNQIFVGNTAMIEARWPNATDPMYPAYYEIEADSSASTTSPYPCVIKSTNLTQADNFWDGAIVQAGWGGFYAYPTGLVTSYATGTLNFNLDVKPSWNTLIGSGADPGFFWIAGNCYNALDTATEWYYDSGTSTLYFWAPGGVNPTTLDVSAKARNAGFVLDDLSYITISDIRIFGCNVTTDADSHHITLDSLTVDYPSHWIRNVSGSVSAVLTDGAYDSGIVLDGSDELIQDSTIRHSSGNLVSIVGDNCTVLRCTLEDAGYARSKCTFINVFSNRRTTGASISHCSMDTCSYIGVFLLEPASSVLYNTMTTTDANDMTYDLGCIYSIDMDGEDTEIAYNRFYDWYYAGVYLDADCRDFRIHHNTFDFGRGSGAALAVQVNGPCRDVRVENNTAKRRIGGNAGTPTYTGTTFINNIVYRESNYGIPYWSGGVGTGYTSATNITTGTGGEVVDANDLFVDYTNNDFRLKPGCAAVGTGTDVGYDTDLRGYPDRGEPDIGAYAYGLYFRMLLRKE